MNFPRARHAKVRQRNGTNVRANFLELETGPTITKRRFIDRYFFHKLFEVYEMDDSELSGAVEETALEQLDALLPEHDVVVLCDSMEDWVPLLS